MVSHGRYVIFQMAEHGLRGIDLRLLEPGPRRVAIGRGIVERLLRRDLAARACSSLSLYGPGFRGFMAENAATPAYG